MTSPVGPWKLCKPRPRPWRYVRFFCARQCWGTRLSLSSSLPLSQSGLLPNEYKNSTTFRDATSSAMIASAIYRLAAMDVSGACVYVPQADRIRRTVYEGIDVATGWNSPTVDPLDWYVQSDESPEGAAFVLIMEAAWRDLQNTCGACEGKAAEADASTSLSVDV